MDKEVRNIKKPVFQNLNLLIILEIALGATLSILLSDLLGLRFATTAGITTLLTIQNSRDLTIKTTLQRYAAFILMLVLAYAVMQPLGFTALSFGLFLLFYVALCLLLNVQAVIASNAVLATHFLSLGHMQPDLIWNAFLLLTIGAGVGVALNLVIPHQRKPLAHYRDQVEQALRDILVVLAGRIQAPVAAESQSLENTRVQEVFLGLSDQLVRYQAAAQEEGGNRFAGSTNYPVRYFQMRTQQVVLLLRIWDNLLRVKGSHDLHQRLSDFFLTTSRTFSERNNALALLRLHEGLQVQYQAAPLPATRQEFEDRALMYTVLMDIKSFLEIKRDFISGVKPEDLRRFWS
ncbi:MAG: aromatic acid exporter family protein [Clostridiales bacterium]|nr:aromatic acid exporter family protein [Clostridiales bacterium]